LQRQPTKTKKYEKPKEDPKEEVKEDTKEEQNEDTDQSYTSEDEPKEEPKLDYHIERHYFKVKDEPSKEEKKLHIYDVEYLLSFKDWKICQEDKLLDSMLIEHINSMEKFISEEKGGKQGGKHNKNQREDKKPNKKEEQSQFQRSTTMNNENKAFTRTSVQLDAKGSDLQSGVWGRKDHSAANKIADEYREEKKKINDKDPMRLELTELLNMLTYDNYEQTKNRIFELIQNEVSDQEKFLEVLFKKAVSEKAFVVLYAKICKEIDKLVPQKQPEKTTDKTTQTKTTQQPSLFRGKLLERCKEIFKIENNERIDHYIKVSDPDERMAKLKKFLLGNVNFIAELINTRLLSKRIVFQCLSNLFARIEKKKMKKIYS